MLKYQRKQEIVNFLIKYGSASIVELIDLCNVSQMTIRRDLNELEEEGVVKRTHGGAVYTSSYNELPFNVKASHKASIKNQLTRFAVERFVKNNMIIILEGGSTIRNISNYLSTFKNLTIFSNGLNTIINLNRIHPTSTVICSGGIVRWVNNTVVGPIATNFFQTFNADIGFFSSIGLTLEDGFTDADVLESQARHVMSQACKKTVLILQSDKIGVRSATTTFKIEEVDVLITDNNAPTETVGELKSRGLEVLIVDCVK